MRLREWFKGKRRVKGDISAFLASMLGVLSLFTVYLIGMNSYVDLRVKQSLDTVGNRYLLYLESNGDLNDQEVIELQNKVKSDILNAKDDAGNKKYDIKEDTLNVKITPGTYYRTVSIEIECKVNSQIRKLEKRTIKSGIDTYVNYHQIYSSTSKS